MMLPNLIASSSLVSFLATFTFWRTVLTQSGWLIQGMQVSSMLLGPWKWELEETSEKQTPDPDRQLSRMESLDVAEGLTNNTAEGKDWALILQTQERHDLEELWRPDRQCTVSRQHPLRVWLQGAELVCFLQDVSPCAKWDVGRVCRWNHMSVHDKVYVKGILKLWQQSLAREFMTEEISGHNLSPVITIPRKGSPRELAEWINPKLVDSYANLNKK